ncbi:MAG: DUF2461 domain-containing protein [bacterium]|nr:MAG: DUF2461 domain-containing protein [bacterium]
MSDFSGFPRETVTFLADLARNNNRRWFNAHREDFDRMVIEPAKAFVEALGARIISVAPGIIADPRVNGSIFRIYRDTRFARDKKPYKTHLGIFLWEGEGPKMECPGFYFHLEPPDLMLGAGIHLFSRALLEEYRNSVVHPRHGHDLVTAAMEVSRSFTIGGLHYKKVPRGFDGDHPYAQFLLYNGLTAWTEGPLPEEIHSPEIVELAFRTFEVMLPLHRWLLAMTARSREKIVRA